MTPLERFTSKYEPITSGCWQWRAGFFEGENGPKYGAFWWLPAGKNIHASRAAWLLLRGAIPDGLMVLHKCDNKACVNPDHLYLGTHADNMRDSVERGRHERGAQRYNFVRSEELTERVRLLRHEQRMTVKEIMRVLDIGWGTVYRCLGTQSRNGRRPKSWYAAAKNG